MMARDGAEAPSDPVASLTDVTNAYNLILGRPPESTAVASDKVGLTRTALVAELLRSEEFGMFVLAPLVGGQAVGPGRFVGRPPARLRVWSATWLALTLAERDAALKTSDWTSLWQAVFGGDGELSRTAEEILGASATTELRIAVDGRAEGLGVDSFAQMDALTTAPITDAQLLERLSSRRNASATGWGAIEDIAKDVRRSGLFDDQFYWATNPDVHEDPLTHYLQAGWRQGRRPNALFDLEWYWQTYPDVPRTIDPLLHYMKHGASEDRNPGPAFDTARYRHAQHLQPGVNPLGHAVQSLAPILRSSGVQAEGLRMTNERFLIVAELSIPQCRKYRVDQKKELLARLGCDAAVISWTDILACRAALPYCTTAIFYRTPGTPEVLALIEEAQNRGMRTFWEVDDLVFDANEYILNDNLRRLPSEVQLNVLSGVPSYRAAMQACGAGIASTTALAAAMAKAGLDPVYIVQNALDESTLTAAAHLRKPPPGGGPVIVYGSGTDTHDVDFLECAAAILQLLLERPELKLKIIGDLNLPESFEDVRLQIQRVPKLPYAKYLQALSEADVCIAPLQAGLFNACKSNIKLLESAIVGVPCVCSDAPPFRPLCEAGAGLLADSLQDWRDCLKELLDTPQTRGVRAEKARRLVLERYSPETIARTEVAQLLLGPPRAADAFRVLVVNIFYAPRSFGGATIVAENMAKLLSEQKGAEVLVFTSLPDGVGTPYSTMTYEIDGVPVVGLSLPSTQDAAAEFDNPHTMAPFREVLKSYRPDVVHFHSIQGLGGTLAQVCLEEKMPYVVTAHDAWWICGRQFMVTRSGDYCNQTRIDLNVCSACVANAGLNIYRNLKLRHLLAGAERVLTPSRFFADLYVQNGFDDAQVHCNRNGVARPKSISRTTGEKLRFGFVGGNSEIKGAHLLRKVFSGLARDDYELLLVDNTTMLGFSSVREADWPISGDLIIVPAYTQAELDAFFDSIDVLLFPTQWKESFGLTVREALLRDVWVIATDAGGVAEDIVPGENGDVLAFDDDGVELAAAVQRAIGRTAELKQHVNSYKSLILDIQEQAGELYGHLREVADAAAVRTNGAEAHA